jgi:hypothetical protein
MLNKKFNEQNFEKLLFNLLPDYKKQLTLVKTDNKMFDSSKIIGYSEILDLKIFVLETSNLLSKVAITKEMFSLLRKLNILKAIVVYIDEQKNIWRLSLLEVKLDLVDNKISLKDSNYSKNTFLLGEGEKILTAQKLLIENGPVRNFEELSDRFSIEIVNKEFYTEIVKHFSMLIGAKRIVDGIVKNFKKEMIFKDQDLSSGELQEFSVRLIGRLIFVWFLKHKKSDNSISLVPSDLLEHEVLMKSKNIYKDVIEPLFFELLNKPLNERKKEFRSKLFDKVPYLNGGLFRPHYTDFYDQSIIQISNEWFLSIIQIFEKFNFTIDEADLLTKDISVDPEMLGRVFENLLAEINPETGESARKATGSFYTPKNIVDLMVNSGIKNYLKNNTAIDPVIIDKIIEETILSDLEINDANKEILFKALLKIKIIDPASGSGAFPIGALNKIFNLMNYLDNNNTLFAKYNNLEPKFQKPINYLKKVYILKNCIFGVDIQTVATEIARLRSFLTLIVEDELIDEKYNRGIEPLPNLEFKFVTANSLNKLDFEEEDTNLFSNNEYIDELSRIRAEFFSAENTKKEELKVKFFNIQKLMKNQINTDNKGIATEKYIKLSIWDPFNDDKTDWFSSEWIFGHAKFDVVIMNPPYVSNKKIEAADKENLKRNFGFLDDLYNHFFFKSFEFLDKKSCLIVISPDTYFTIDSKKKLRQKLLAYNIKSIIHLGYSIFESAMVSTAIIILNGSNFQTNKIEFLDYKYTKKTYYLNQSVFNNSINQSIFTPTKENIDINNLLSNKYTELTEKYGYIISSSKSISKYKNILKDYLEKFDGANFTLLGLVTEGGAGLQTGNNGLYIGVIEGSKESIKIFNERKKKIDILNKLKEKNYKLPDKEEDVWIFMDNLRNRYGLKVFGRNFIYRIVPKSLVSDKELNDYEKINGITSLRSFVPYDKGDKDGNKWFLETPYYIDWSSKNVKQIVASAKKGGLESARYQGYNFFFQEGLCWSDVSYEIKARLKGNSIHDVASMSLFSTTKKIPNFYIISLLNSSIVSKIVNNFLNNTVHFQINDARNLIIPIPSKKNLDDIEKLFNSCVNVQKDFFSGIISKDQKNLLLKEYNDKLNSIFFELYGLKN